jgi:hypothetical protein
MMQAPRRASEHEDPLKALEDEAYQGDASPPAQYRGEYAHIGGPVYEKSFRAQQIREWPMHTDFSPDNLEMRD